MPRPKPLTFQVRPITSGINSSEPSTEIDLRETPITINTRFTRGLLALRNGFKKKYAGADESILWIDTLYSGGFTNVIGITAKAVYYLDTATDSMKLMAVWNGLDTPDTAKIDYPYFTMENLVSYIAIDVGEGIYDFYGANAGAEFPDTANTAVADLLVLVNGTSDGIYIFAYTGAGDIEHSGTFTAVAGTDVTLAADASTSDDEYNTLIIEITGYDGTAPAGLIGQTRTISDYVGATKVATVASAWTVAPDTSTQYKIVVSETTPAEGEWINPSTHPGAPAGGRSVAIFDNRIFVGGNENEPSTIIWSAKQRFDQWSAEDGAGYIILGDSPDWIQSMKRLGEYLIVYKERSIYIGQTTGLTDPPVRFDAAPGQGIGLAAPNSIGDLGEEHIFLGWDNVYVFSVRAIKAVGTKVKNEMFFGEYGILPEYLNNCTGVIAEEFGEYWLFVPTGRWPSGTGGEGGTPEVKNVVENPSFNQGIEGPIGPWVITGTGGFVTELTGAKFGLSGVFLDTSAVLTKESITFSTGADYSFVLWCRPDSTITTANITITAGDFSSTFDVVHEIDDTTSLRFVRSGTVSSGTTVTITVNSGSLYVDAMHVVPLTGIDDVFIYETANGDKDVAFLNAYDEAQAIPLISRAVGAYLPDTVWVYNYEYDAWSAWRLPMTGFGYDSIQNIITIDTITGIVEQQNWRFDDKRIEALAPTNLLGQPDGQIYEMKSDLLYDWEGVIPTPVIGFWESKDFDLDAPHIDKTMSRLLIYHDPTHPANTVTVGVSTDGGSTWIEQDVPIRVGSPYTIADFFVTGSMVRFRIRGASPGFFIDGFGVKLIPRGEAHAY